MEAETPATGIMKTGDYADSKFYNVECSCGSDDDAIGFNVEWDEEVNEVIVHTWTVQKTPWWNEIVKANYKIENPVLEWLNWRGVDLINGVYRRLQLTWQIWFYGYVKYESYTSMTRQQALNYAKVLEDAVKQVEEGFKVRQEERDLRRKKIELEKRVKKLEEENAKLKWSLSQQD